MTYLMDTHTFLWFVDGTEDLPPSVRSLIVDPANDIHISIASFWEIGIKASLANSR